MKAATMNDRWYSGHQTVAPPPSGLAALGRRLWHGLGATRRALDAELAEVLRQIEPLRELDETALAEALAAMRVEARLGRMPTKPGEFAAAHAANRIRALALLATAAERAVHWRPHPPQIRAALAMHGGLLVDMPAGDGKTLAVALAAILHAWRGRPCHVATVNEYLARRDADLMRPLYARCGLSVAAATQSMQPEQAGEVYRTDVLYATGKQLLADYLRDQIIVGGIDDPLRMHLRGLAADAGNRQPLMRGLYAVIVDDAETVLFDEATTPVVISAPSDNPMLVEAVRAARELVGHLQDGRDYRWLERRRDIEFTAAGEARLEQHGDLLPQLWRTPERRDDLVRQAIVVRDLLHPQRHYIIQQGRLSIVDDYIGRLLARPAWTQGLHQAIEVKEGLEPSPPSRVLARMSVSQFFLRYRQLGGIGVAVRALRGEAWRSLGRLCLGPAAAATVSPHRCQPAIFADQAGKRAALVDTLYRLHQRGMPVLVSLRRVSDVESIAKQLAERQVKCQFFNPRQTTDVTETLNGMARPGQISLTLNLDACGADLPIPPAVDTMAALGVTEPFGDSPASPELADTPGLRVLQYELQELARQDRRILDLVGRRGQSGLARQYLAIDDDLFQYHLPAWCRGLLTRMAKNSPRLLPRITLWLVRYAQYRAQNLARRQRLTQPRREALLNQQLAFAGDRDMDVGAQHFGKL